VSWCGHHLGSSRRYLVTSLVRARPRRREVNASPLRIEPDRGGLSRIESDGGVRFSGKTAGERGHRFRFESHRGRSLPRQGGRPASGPRWRLRGRGERRWAGGCRCRSGSCRRCDPCGRYAAYHLQSHLNGSGVLLTDVPHVTPPRVVVIGYGNAGAAAARTARSLGCDVVVLGANRERLRRFAASSPGVTCRLNTPAGMVGAVESEVAQGGELGLAPVQPITPSGVARGSPRIRLTPLDRTGHVWLASGHD
jgi:hypothetical protein